MPDNAIMDEKLSKTILGSLLHDIGKVVYRSGEDGRSHSVSGKEFTAHYTSDKDILDCIAYHHRDAIAHAGKRPERDSISYLVYAADNFAAGADRRDCEESENSGFEKTKPLSSIFNLMNNNKGKEEYLPLPIGEEPQFGKTGLKAEKEDYVRLLHFLGEAMRNIEFSDAYCNSLLEIMEGHLSYVPSSTQKSQVSDISLFDHVKLTAAFASCCYLYEKEKETEDYETVFFNDEDNFRKEKTFMIVSFDFSGIQPFIYSVPEKGALKSLRTRSTYLELLAENTADQMLGACSLSRANLLYLGGGHAYMILPNTKAAAEAVETATDAVNNELQQMFGIKLFMGCGMQSCSADELMGKSKDENAYSAVFRSVSAQISKKKLQRYDAPKLIEMNTKSSAANEERECAVCGRTGKLRESEDGLQICSSCAAFYDISGTLLTPEAVFMIRNEKAVRDTALRLPSINGEKQYLQVETLDGAKRMLREEPNTVSRVYSKNIMRTGLNLATKIWMGDYAARSTDGSVKSFEELAQCSQGVERLAVLRADVDNLGTAFTSGFVRSDKTGAERNRYTTLSRTSTFSRNMSLFFKHYINWIISNPVFKLSGKERTGNAVIVYSGGDDVFIVGSWDELICIAIDLHNSFSRYTSNTLTLSAGIAVFDDKYPVTAMAAETGRLEDEAKRMDDANGKKDAISLFGMESLQGTALCRHTYHWDTFEKSIIGEKVDILEELFILREDLGNSFLYQMLTLLRNSEQKINLARLAYVLARRECPHSASAEAKDAYERFTKRAYTWALSEKDRQEFITAIMIFVYTRREKEEA